MLPKSALDSHKIFHPELMQGKVLLVTGGSNGGMLSEIARAFLRHGAKAVYLMARKADKLQAVCAELSKHGKAVAITGDVRKTESCVAACQGIVDAEGRLDVLVNGAAGNFLASAEKLTANGMRTVLEIDTLGTFNMSQAAFTTSMKKNGGTIINISATLHWNGSALQAHSSAAKAGVDALTKVLATEWGPYNVRVTGIVPGAIAGTEGFERLGSLANMNNKKATNDAFKNKASSEGTTSSGGVFIKDLAPVPISRFGEVEDIANCALFLAGPSGAYMTGTNVVVDGGAYLTMPNMMFAQPKFVDMWQRAKL